jgi:hypothetical protein
VREETDLCGCCDLHPALKPDFKNKSDKKKGANHMLKKLLGAAAVAATAYAVMPAHAARVGIGCSGANLEKTESAVEAMADGPARFMAQREMAQAQEALLNGQMRVCAMHLTRAMQAGSLSQAPYAPAQGAFGYADTLAQAPADARRPPAQPQGQWKPVQSAQ